MLSQKQIRQWIPDAVSAFQSVMPPISKPYPIIQIASSATLNKVRSHLVEQTKSQNRNIKNPYTSMMEMLYGHSGTAILIYQKLCPESKDEFNHALWHELGHFYAISAETESFFLLADQKTNENQIRQSGYWLWNEFIAECISNHVGKEINSSLIENTDYNCQLYWRQTYLRLQYLIQLAYNILPYSFSEYDLAIYYATLLTDPYTVTFVNNAINNELTVWDPNKESYIPMRPDSIEPTALSLLPKEYVNLLLDITDLLRDKVEEIEFWKVDESFLDRLGLIVNELNIKKSMQQLLKMQK
ncbi:MAG: hypothetical protein K6G27_12765 [Lachnospiraceae bacterium]|nr:hypothetical protein [Lachnospiraceae bacterium]